MKSSPKAVISTALTLVLLAACGPIQTKNEVDIKQDKPIEVDVNVHADIDVVITDARRDLEQITGQKPVRNVGPADIGLDPDTTPPATAPAGAALQTHSGPLVTESGPLFMDIISPPAPHPLAAEDDLKSAMAARAPQVRALLDTHNAGESHTGLLADPHPDKSDLTADQKALMNAENKDRAAFYKIEAGKKGVTEESIEIAYYQARLGYAKKGDWYDRRNKETKQWEWTQFDK